MPAPGGFRLRRAHPGAPPPAPILPTDFGNDGSGSKPVGAIDVTTSTWFAALTSASAGAVLYLAPGSYDFTNVTGFSKGTGAGVTLYGQAGVTTQYLSIISNTGLHFKYISCLAPLGGVPIWLGGIYAEDSDTCSFDHITVQMGALSSQRSNGVLFRNATNITMTNCDIFQVGAGFSLVGDAGTGLDSHDFTVTGNRFQRFIENCCQWKQVNNVHFKRNIIRIDDILAGHADFVQITDCAGTGLVDAESGLSWGVIVEENYAEASVLDVDLALQGIGGSCENVTNALFRRNCCLGSSHNGISCSHGINWLITDNLYTGNALRTFGDSVFTFRDGSDQCTAEKNWTQGIFNSDPPIGTDRKNGTITIAGDNVTVAAMTDYSDTTLRDTWLALPAHSNVPHF